MHSRFKIVGFKQYLIAIGESHKGTTNSEPQYTRLLPPQPNPLYLRPFAVRYRKEPRMHANGRELILKDEVFEIVGCAMEVLNELGHGLHEKPYERAMVVGLGLRGIPYFQQPRHDVLYKGVVVGEYIPDLVVRKQLVVDTKVIERITNHELGRMMNYLKITGLTVGLILNFKRAKLEWKRVVLENNRA